MSTTTYTGVLHGKYLVYPRVEATVKPVGHTKFSVHSKYAIPTLLLSASSASPDALLHSIEALLKANDDVLCEDFLTHTVVIREKPLGYNFKALTMKTSIGLKEVEWKIEEFLTIDWKVDETQPPDGPYFLVGNEIHQAWKLYEDHLDAFASTVIPNPKNPEQFTVLEAVAGDGIWSPVAVPSRLYDTPSNNRPLAGKRFTIKDNFQLAGIRTAQSNRAFLETYGPETESAEYIQTLLRKGAIILGKTKMCAFASAEEATDQWIDFHAPFNPRADGYQSPSGSTTGGAVALAGYEWIDYSIGTDTTGSTRMPAARNGLFGIRTTTGISSLAGVYPSCKEMDTLGFLGRDMDSVHKLLSLTTITQPFTAFPRRILYPTEFYPVADTAQQAIIDDYIKVLEDFLGVEKTVISISQLWDQSPPPESQGLSLKEYIQTTAYYPFYYDGYHEYDQFRSDYRERFGKEVYVGPYMRWKWDIGAKVTIEQVTKSMEEWAVYRNWFENTILRKDGETGSDAILLLPLGGAGPKYRDEHNPPPKALGSLSSNYIAAMLGLPQFVTPIGQLPYESRVSGRTEYVPIVGSIAGAKGSDLMLVNLVKAAFEHSNWPTSVLTGRLTFQLGDGHRNVAKKDSASAHL